MKSVQGLVVRSLSGVYEVAAEDGSFVSCKPRGKFRRDGISPLVGDRVRITVQKDESGSVEEILPRKNVFIRPPVANIDCMVLFACAVTPVTDFFLLDRMIAVAEDRECETVICINKSDLDPGEDYFSLYSRAGFRTIRTSAVTGEGIEELRDAIRGKVCAFTGNSGVGKSSVLNALEPGFSLKVGEVSEKLGRGKHTTRHVELFPLSCGARIADTPGFSAFDTEVMGMTVKENVQFSFREFAPYIGKCRFSDCAHRRESDCAVREAVEAGMIAPSRYESYVKLYEQAMEYRTWEKSEI